MSIESSDGFDAELIQIVAHDLKTPLSAVKGFIELVQHAGPLNERQQYFSEKALGGLQRMETMIAHLLDIARLEGALPFELVRCDLAAIITDAVGLQEQLAAARDIRIHVELQETPVYVVADERLLSHVVNNLLSNAIKYNRDGGDVWVRARVESRAVRVDVQDTGIGIAPENLKRVFERFVRVRIKRQQIEGTGLGLSIAETIVEKHGGHIWAESTPGEGSTFSFTLPLEGSTAQTLGSGGGLSVPHTGPAGEPLDDVDDDLQETQDASDPDSHSDDL